MSKKCRKAPLFGAVILLSVMCFSVSGSAQIAGGTEGTIKVYVDGVLLAPANDSPKASEPLLYDGTVYLPIWALSEALGKPVEWDSTTNSVYIGAPAEIVEITVSTAEELVSALGSNRRILLEEGIYDLTTENPAYMNANVYFGEKHDGAELILDGIHNLTIQGIGDAKSEIIVEPRYANVLNFQNCSNISIVNIKAGHTEGGVCSGGVFLFSNCTDIQIVGTDMYGCGTIGLIFERVRDVRVTDSTIYACTTGILNAYGSSNILLKDCVFRDNATNGSIVSAEHTSGLTFDTCSFLRNSTGLSMFYLSGSENIAVENSEFIENKVPALCEAWKLEVDASTRFENNLFDAIR